MQVRKLLIGFTLFLLLLVGVVSCTTLRLSSPSSQQAPTPTVDRLAPPVMPNKPSQADKGAYVFYQVCMACHGDRGQGLTDEWREGGFGEDSNCWQSDCHGNNHPRDGFLLIKTVPPVFGSGTFTRFKNGQELHDYLVKTMPWWKPGYLQAQEYWELTAYLMRQRGILPKGVELNEGNARIFLIRPVTALPKDSLPMALLFAGLLVLAAGAIVVHNKLPR